MVYPADWRLAHGDPGSATAVRRGSAGRFVGYLNLTPRQGDEQLSTWPSFRIAHNRAEGNRHVTLLAHATGLPFRTGTGSCVIDTYETVTSARYTEIACLVSGSHTSSVIVGAAPPQSWPTVKSVLEQAVANVSS